MPLSDVDWSTLDVVQMTHSYSSSSSTQTTEQGFGEGVVNAMPMNESQKETKVVDQKE